MEEIGSLSVVAEGVELGSNVGLTKLEEKRLRDRLRKRRSRENKKISGLVVVKSIDGRKDLNRDLDLLGSIRFVNEVVESDVDTPSLLSDSDSENESKRKMRRRELDRVYKQRSRRRHGGSIASDDVLSYLDGIDSISGPVELDHELDELAVMANVLSVVDEDDEMHGLLRRNEQKKASKHRMRCKQSIPVASVKDLRI